MATSNGIKDGKEFSTGITMGKEITSGITDGGGIEGGKEPNRGIRAGVRDYLYPSGCAFQKGERLRHSYYGEGSVLAVIRDGISEIIIVELDDKTKSPLQILQTSRTDFHSWLGRTDILRLKYLA